MFPDFCFLDLLNSFRNVSLSPLHLVFTTSIETKKNILKMYEHVLGIWPRIERSKHWVIRFKYQT